MSKSIPSAIVPGDAFDHAIHHLRRRLADPLPGLDAHRDLAPSQRTFTGPDEARAAGGPEGGALILIYPLGGAPHLVLTLRRPDLRVHAGQISLPGGRVEPGESPREAALREAWEELAIPPEGLDVLGMLTPIYIPPTRYLLYPTVAARAERPDFRPQPSEVAALIEAPVAHFVGGANRRVEIWDLRGEPRRVPFFEVGPHKVWGATAMILRELAAVWAGADLPAAVDPAVTGEVSPAGAG